MYLFSPDSAYFEPGQVRNLSTEWLDVIHLGVRQTFRKDYEFTLHQVGGGRFGFILKGRICTFIPLEDGHQKTMLYLNENCLFFESYAFAGCYDQIVYHRCKTDVEIVFFEGSILSDDEFLKKYPSLIRNCGYSISRKLVNSEALFSASRRKFAFEKIAWYITRLYQYHGQALTFSPQLSQVEIAQLLGIHKATMTRAITTLRNMNIIGHFSKKQICILDYERLVKILE